MLFYLINWIQAQMSFILGEDGQDLVEYALLLGLIALIAIAGVTFLGEQISTVMSELGSTLADQI